jgi:hypothetical protein
VDAHVSEGADKFADLVRAMCVEVGAPDVDEVIRRGAIEIGGYEVLLAHYSNDERAMYLNFNFGIATAGRTERLFKMMLESNFTIYSQDQAQLGVHPDTGGLLLIVRVPMTDEVDGAYLAETFTHYAEHGKYWRDNQYATVDEMNDPALPHQFVWMRA